MIIFIYLVVAILVAVFVAEDLINRPPVYHDMPLFEDMLSACVGLSAGAFWPVLLPALIVLALAKLLSLAKR